MGETVHLTVYRSTKTKYLEKGISCNLILVFREGRSFGVSVRPHPHPKKRSEVADERLATLCFRKALLKLVEVYGGLESFLFLVSIGFVLY